jgi:ribonucleoside-diphosphate reductase alpha chain
MRWARFYTEAGRDVFDGARFRAVATEEWLEYTVPAHWNQPAVDILLEKIFYPETLPAITRRIEEPGVPVFLRRREADDTALDGISAEFRYHTERDIREVLHRVAGALTYGAWKNKFISTEEEAEIFYDELRYVMLHQIAAPELAQWARLGLEWAYGLSGADFMPLMKKMLSGG